jgi:NADH-ubiquinone oxidoreductase chain 6
LLSNNINSLPLALFIIILLNYVWTLVSPQDIRDINSITPTLIDSINTMTEFASSWLSLLFSMYKNLTNVMFISSNNWDGFITGTSHIVGVGMVLYTVYSIWLLLASLILLLAMVGSIVITVK